MKVNIEIKYIIVYSILTITSIILALQFWWTDLHSLSQLTIELMALLLSAGIYWMAIIYISIFVIRKYVLELEIKDFIGPIDLVTNEYFQKILEVKSLKIYLNFTSCILFISSIIVFNVIMNTYKHHEINENGKIETIIVKDIHIGGHGSVHIYFEYNHKDYYHLPNMKNLNIGDSTSIIFSTENPKLVEYYLE